MSQTTSSQYVPGVSDDMTQIRGIGPGIERRLHAAGILTFAQLAACSSAELAVAVGDLVGMSAERVADQDWAGQARQLTSLYEAEKTEAEIPNPESRRHYALFTVELLMDDENIVRRTRAVHIQSREDDIWAGWDGSRLLDFFTESSELKIPAVDQSAKEVHANEEALSSPIPNMDILTKQPAPIVGDVRVGELEVMVPESDEPQKLLRCDRPFAIHLSLDATKLTAVNGDPLPFAAMVFAKRLGSGNCQLVGKTEGNLVLSECPQVKVSDLQLPSGTYRMDAFVKLTTCQTNMNSAPGLMATARSQLIRVY